MNEHPDLKHSPHVLSQVSVLYYTDIAMLSNESSKSLTKRPRRLATRLPAFHHIPLRLSEVQLLYMFAGNEIQTLRCSILVHKLHSSVHCISENVAVADGMNLLHWGDLALATRHRSSIPNDRSARRDLWNPGDAKTR